jgi:dihydroxyacid dehydratase/phosphogluconate dehydratase
MKQATIVAEFQQFTKEKGYEVEGRIAIFNQNEEAAREFHAEANKGGFDVVIDYNQAGSYSGADDLSKLPKYWYVRLAP